MKKLIVFLLVLLVPVFVVFPAAAEEEFEISGGVLVAYNGNSSEVTVPGGVLKIGDNAFSGNGSVVTVNLPQSVYSIGNRAFYNCSSLKTLNGTENVTEIGAYAFTGTALINSADPVSINHILIYYGGNDEKPQIPTGTVSIAPYAFAGNTAVRSVNIPQSVVSIGEGAFYGCTSLASVSVPAAVYSIGPFAFSQTAWLESRTGDFVVLGNGILIAYKGNSEIVYVPGNIKQIGGGAFYGNESIQQVIVSRGCLAVQLRAFAECPKLQRIYLPGTVIGIDPLSFENSSQLKITADSGSFAERFAQAHSIPLDDTPLPLELGDVNGDFSVTSLDATLILQYSAGILKADSPGFDVSLADVNFDGNITSLDATLILQRSAGIIDSF